MSKVLIIGEHNDDGLNPSVARIVACAAELSPEAIDVAMFGNASDAACSQAAELSGVSKVLNVGGADAQLGALVAPQVVALSGGYTHILAGSSSFGKDLMPVVAAKLGIPQVSDIMKVNGENSFDRPIYAGNAVVTVETPAGIMCGTVRAASYSVVAGGNSAAVEATSVDAAIPTHTRFVSEEVAKSDRPDLQSASKVVSGGRAMGSAENFEIIFNLADTIGAGCGASRAAVDSGYVPNDMQVGQTGKIIAPDLYVACGISGAIQHLAGIKDAGVIVAINTDADAPIFEVADYGLVADLFEAVPELTAALS